MDQIKNHPLYRRHNIDSAMSALWEFYKKKFIVLFILSLVMSGILQFAVSFSDLNSISSVTDPMLMLEKFKELLLPIALVGLLSLFFNTVLHYYILHAPIREENVILESLWKSAIYFLPYLIIIIILTFVGAVAIILGLIALIVGVFFSITYIAMLSFFILPVMMVEESSIDTTIMRTVKLAHRNFWPNMGWTAVFIILFLIISVVLSGLALIPFAGSFMSAFANPEDAGKLMTLPGNPLFLVISSAINALTLPLFPIFAFIVYFNGKAQEDNVNIQPAGGSEEYKVRVEDLYARPRDENDKS